MSDLTIEFILGAIAPLIMAVFWITKNPRIRAVVAVVVCVVFAAAYEISQYNADFQMVFTAFLRILTVAFVLHKALWEPLGVTPAIEDATTPDR